MAQIFGEFIEQQGADGEYLKIGFSPTSLPIQQCWRNNGLSADFLADYLSTFFLGEDATSAERQAEVKGAVSYVANELLENAMKFSYAPSHHAIRLAIRDLIQNKECTPDLGGKLSTSDFTRKVIEGFGKFYQH